MGGTATKIKLPVLHLPPLLHEAASRNDTETIEKLLAAITNIENGLKVLKKVGNAATANWSLTRFVLNVARNEKGQTPLHAAVENNCFEATKILIKEGGDVNAQDDRGDTVYHIAMRNQSHKIGIHLFNLTGPFFKLKDVQNEDGDSALHIYIASSRENKYSTVMLFTNRWSTDVFNCEGYSPFHQAIKLGRLDVVETLLELQPHLAKQLSANGEPPLWVALKHCQMMGNYSNASLSYLDMMQVLLKHGCDVNQKNTKIGAPTIWLAAYRQREEDVKATELLLENPEFDKMTIEAPSHDGTSPLLLAMIKGNEKLVSQLIRVSANKNEWQILALKVKFALVTKADFEKIRNNDIMLDATDNHGNTLLHLAVLSDSLEMVSGLVNAGCSMGNIENVMDLAKERQCANILDCLTGIILGAKIGNMKTIITFSIPKEFPKFSDAIEDLFDPLKQANQTSLTNEPNAKGQISYEDLKKHIIAKVDIEWTKAIIKDISPMSHMLLQMKENHSNDQNTAMVKDFLSILVHIETYMLEEDELFKHMDVVLLPVGSTVEGTKVGKLNELDVMFFCTALHGSLSVIDECTINLTKNKYNSLPIIIKDLFDLNTKKLSMAKFFEAFLKAVKRAVHDLVIRDKVPKNIEVFMNDTKCTDLDCKANAGEEWSQCHHKEPPCVCYTAVGAGLNFIWKGDDENKNMVFTVDIVPNFYVDLNGLSNVSLRQKLIKYLMDEKPFGWVDFLKKYIRDDRIYMGQFDLEENNVSFVGIKMVNSRGDFVIRPGLNMHVEDMLKDMVVHETYCFLKVLKAITASKAKSFDLKKAISDQLRGSQVKRPRDVFAFAKQVLHSPDLRGKFDGLCQSLTERYLQVDLVDFPAKNSSCLAIHLVPKKVSELLSQIKTRNVREFQQMLQCIVDRPAVKDMLVQGRSLLHFAAESLNVDMTRILLVTAGCDANLQDLEGNTPLHCMLHKCILLLKNNSDPRTDQLSQFENGNDDDRKGMVQLLASNHHNDNDAARLELQNKNGYTVFHLLAMAPNIGPMAEDILLSKASIDMLNLRDHKGRTAAMLACCCKIHPNEDFIMKLLNRGTFIEASDNKGFTLLHYACQFCSHILVDHLLIGKAGINVSDKKGSTPLMQACHHGNLNVMKLLLQKGADVNAVDNEGNTVILYAVDKGHVGIVQILMQSGVDLYDSTPIIWALQKRHYAILKLLIKFGASDVNIPDRNGNLVLVYASQEGLTEYVRLFVENGAAVDLAQKAESLAPLYMASQNGHLEVVELLLKYGATVDLEREGITPLFIASKNGHLEVVKLLIRNAADVDQATKTNGQRPLYTASENGHLKIVKFLLNNGADVNKTDNNNISPLAISAMNGHANIVSLLLENNADTKIANSGMMRVACEHGYLDEVKRLVREGVAIDEKCMEIARQFNQEEVMKYLIKNTTSIK